MYLKNLGAIHKAVFVVPNPLVGQWATEFYRFFPNANLLVSTVEDFTLRTGTAIFPKSPPENTTR